MEIRPIPNGCRANRTQQPDYFGARPDSVVRLVRSELEGAIVGGFIFLGSYIAMAALLTPASTLAASIAAVAIGGSPAAVIGTILARRADRKHKDYYENQIRHGGILMWVRVADPEKERLAVTIMKEHSGRDVHVHSWSQ